ncbi:hypothetical protein PHLCEN_2v8833 [Hermanssonia centrifuga]|uniref:Pentatricopeptide repeat-containing protein n=1 Tax=Hermanssonia centrifuga TaxID=98765 RepID=A0A2R6NSS1_9APHY|nr:hypothetical protein PHLCEN_2v8833 [Hermanssonia centrifuga]
MLQTRTGFQSQPSSTSTKGSQGPEHVKQSRTQHLSLRKPKVKVNPLRFLPQPDPPLVEMVDKLFLQRRAGESTVETLRTSVEPSLLAHLQDSEKARALAALMVNTSVPQRAHRVLLLAHDLGCKFKQNAYEGVAYQLAQTGQWAEMPSLVALGKRQTGRTNARLLNWRARALVEISHFGLLEDVLEDFQEEHIQPNRRTFHVLVSGHIRNRNLAKAKACLEWMEQAGFPMDASTHALIVSNYRSLGADKPVQTRAFESLRELGERTATIVVNSLIQLALDTHDMEGALRYLSYFESSVSSQHDVDSGDVTTPQDGESQENVDQSNTRGTLVPDTATFTMLINYLAKKQDLGHALQILDRMKLLGVVPDSRVAAAVIRAHCAAGDLSTSVYIASTMCEDLPSTRPLFIWLGLEVEDKHRPDLIPATVPMTIEVINALLKGVLVRRGLNGMRVMYDLMRATGLRPNDETVSLFLSHLAVAERMRPRELIRILKRISVDVRPTLEHLHIIFRSLFRGESESVRRRGWQALRARAERKDVQISVPPEKLSTESKLYDPTAGIEVSRLTYGSLIRPLVASLTARRVRVDRATMNLRIRHDSTVKRSMDLARESFQTMLDRGMHANEHHFAALMEGYTLSGDMHTAEEIFKSAMQAGMRPNVVLYTILIHGYAQQGKAGLAMRTFEQMVASGVQPDVGSVDALAGAWFAVGASGISRRVLLQLWPHIAPLPPELAESDLKTLLQTFRQLGSGPLKLRTKQTRQQYRMLRWKLKRIMVHWVREKRVRRQRRHENPEGPVADTSPNPTPLTS